MCNQCCSVWRLVDVAIEAPTTRSQYPRAGAVSSGAGPTRGRAESEAIACNFDGMSKTLLDAEPAAVPLRARRSGRERCAVAHAKSTTIRLLTEIVDLALLGQDDVVGEP